MIRRLLAPLALLLLPGAAWAGRCDGLLEAAGRAQGDALVATYQSLVSCDREVAKNEFQRFMLRAGDLETLVPLTLVAVDGEAWNAVWEMMEKVPYEHRDALAREIGAACVDRPKVVGFLQGAYLGLKGTGFTSWASALPACPSEPLRTWMDETVASPPASPYSEKYNALLTAFVDVRGTAALPTLEQAAVAAGKAGGPFHSVLEAMTRAVASKDVRGTVSPEDEQALEDALVRVAQAVPAESARLVADRLFSEGKEARAASLLPALYPDRVQPNGELLWAAAAVEVCDDDAVVHWTTWTERPTRLDLVEAASQALRGAKPALKCETAEPWPVRVSEEPLADEAAASGWMATLGAEWAGKGLKVKDRLEKKVAVK